MSVAAIGKQLGIHPDRVAYQCILYQKNGGFLMEKPELMPRKRGVVKMSGKIIDHITDPAVVRTWANLNLDERCRMIER